MATPLGPAASVLSTTANTGSTPSVLQQEPLSKDPAEALKKKKHKQRRKKKKLIRRKRNAESGRFEPTLDVAFQEIKSDPAPAPAPARAGDTSDVDAMRKSVLEGEAFVDEKGRVPP